MSAVVSKIPRNQWFVGEDRTFAFRMESTDNLASATWQFVVRRVSTACPGRDDPGDGAVVFTVEDADIDYDGASVNVPVTRADTVDLEPDDYYVALWRTDAGNDRPVAILRYAHLTAVPRQA